MNISGKSGVLLCGLLLCATAPAAEPVAESATDLPAGAQIERMPPGALPAPAETPLSGEAAPRQLEGSATGTAAPPTESAEDGQPLADPPGAVPAPEDTSRI